MAMQAVVSLPSSSCAHCVPATGRWQPRGASAGAGGGKFAPIARRGSATAAECGVSGSGIARRESRDVAAVRSSIAVARKKVAREARGNRMVRCAAEAEAGAGVATTTSPSPSSSPSSSPEPFELNESDMNEVDKDTFWPIVHSAGEKVVVLDMYTQWCGPCKLMLPKLVELASEMDDVIFLKLDCNKHNKPLAKELGIRVVPTFKILKNQKMVGEVTGAKLPELKDAIENARKL